MDAISKSASDMNLGLHTDSNGNPTISSDRRTLSLNTGRTSAPSRPPSHPRSSIPHSTSATSLSMSSTTSSAFPSPSQAQSGMRHRHRQRPYSTSTAPSLSVTSSATTSARTMSPPPPPTVPSLRGPMPKTRDMFVQTSTPSCYGPVETFNLIVMLTQLWSLVLIPYVPRVFYLIPFMFWRLSYNVGIGILLHHQHKTRSITRRVEKLSPDARSLLVWAVSRSIASRPWSWEDTSISFNSWLAFRSLALIILNNDGVAFFVLSVACFTPLSQSSLLTVVCTLSLALPLLYLGVWSKAKAHQAITDYAWFWGDFFFVKSSHETDRTTLGDDDDSESNHFYSSGIFSFFPHPMYTIGYSPMYAASLITRSYLLLLVSLMAHASQIAFLVLVEQPHIDALYGDSDDDGDKDMNSSSNANNSHPSTSFSSLSSATPSPNTSPVLTSSSAPQLHKQSSDKSRNSDNPALRLFEQAAPHPIVYRAMCVFCLSLLFLCTVRTPPALIVVPLCLVMRVLHWLAVSVFLEQPTQGDIRWITLLRSTGTAHSRIFSAWQHSLLLSNMLNHTLFICAAVSTSAQYPTFLDFSIRGCALSNLALVMILFGRFVTSTAYELTGDFSYYYGDFFVSVGSSSSAPPTPGSSSVSSQGFLYNSTPSKLDNAQNGKLTFHTFLCNRGPYRFLRHPQAVCFYFAYYGLALALQSPIAALLACFAHVLHLLFVSAVEVPHLAREYYQTDISSLPNINNMSAVLRTPIAAALFNSFPVLVSGWSVLQSRAISSCSALVSQTVHYTDAASVQIQEALGKFRKVTTRTKREVADAMNAAVVNAPWAVELKSKIKCKAIILQLRRYGLMIHDVGPSAED